MEKAMHDKAEEPRVLEKEIGLAPPDLRLTHQEWIFYWKSRFEASMQKVVLAQKFFEKVKEQTDSMFKEIIHLRKSNEELAAQLKTLQGQRQEDAAKEGGAPEGGKVKPFKRGKKK
jgi:hypothetical protein